jgi:hypothetical protein
MLPYVERKHTFMKACGLEAPLAIALAPWCSPQGAILFAVTEFLATGSQVPLLLVIDAI